MKKSYWKSCLRDLGKTKGRFFAIIAIVALGAGFFGGIKASSVDMKLTADDYYKSTHLYDFRVVSTLGVTDADVAALETIEGAAEVIPSYRADAIIQKKNAQESGLASNAVMRFHALTKKGEINLPVLTEGRMPEAANEVLLVQGNFLEKDLQIGDYFTIDLAQDPDSEDVFAITEFTITGLADSPLYMTSERTSTSKGSGTVHSYALVPEAAFKSEVYTELFVQMEDSQELFCFSPDYDNAAETLSVRLEDIGPERCDARKAEIVDEATETLDDAKAEFNDKKAEADEKLADARRQLDDAQQDIRKGERDLADAKKKIAEGEQELADKQLEYDDAIAEGEQELADARIQLEDGRKELADAKELLDDAKAELDKGESEYDKGSSALSKGQSEYNAGKQQLEMAEATISAGKQQAAQSRDQSLAAIDASEASPEEKAAAKAQVQAGYDSAIQSLNEKSEQLAPVRAQLASAASKLASGRAELQRGGEKLSRGRAEYREGQKTYQEGRQEIIDAENELALGEAEFENGKLDGERQIAEAQQKIADGKRDIISGEKTIADGKRDLAEAEQEYADQKAEADEKLNDAALKIADAEQEIADIDTPDWYVFDRNESSGYAGFVQDADRIDAIAAVFPVFFFLVAALVCLTTMTRMVEEDRTQIGILKSLGYGKAKIMGKYLFYAAFTSLIGSAVGLIIGFQVFPRVIWAAYGIMYTTPPIQTPFNWQFAIIAAAVFLLCTIGSTFIAGWGELMSSPADLIRPKPPKNGKRIILENISFLWKRLSFTQKLTARNILRYKKRFFMTVIGIAGCTALMLTGFGLKDSISGIVPNQFVKLSHYDMQLFFSHELKADAPTLRQTEALNLLEQDERVAETLLVHQQDMKARSEKSSARLDAYLFVPENIQTVPDFFTFQVRKKNTPIPFPEQGAILTEKLAQELNLKPGDSILLEDSDHTTVSITVAGICENYVYNYAYISPAQYRALYGKDCVYQGMLARLGGEGDAFETALSEDLLKAEEISGISFTSAIVDNLGDTFDRLDLVVLVLIISASLLAFVVLYNLTNINVNERIREIATIKVLGFYNREVDSYIYRENIILTLVGIAAGFGCGVLLHQYVMRVAEVNIVMFGREILPLSYLWAGLLTLAFSGAVNFVMHFRLKRVSMVESLKSVE